MLAWSLAVRLLLVPLALSARAEAQNLLLEERSLEHGGLTRYFLEHGGGSGSAAPGDGALVILLHGGGGGMRRLFRGRPASWANRWLELSDENGFLVLVPNGVDPGTGDPRGDSQHWNDLRDDWKGGSDADDVGFLTALVDWAVSDRDVDPSRVYVTGPSNGGMMTYRLLVERPSVFAAGVALIANLPQADVAPPTSSTPLMIMNGTKDKLIPWDGGEVGRNRGVVRSSLATRDYWIGANDADAGAVRRETVSQRTLFNRCRIESEFYPASPAAGAAAPVRFCTMDGGGHVIPTERWTYVSFLYRFIGGPPCWGVSGADISWEFMSTYG